MVIPKIIHQIWSGLDECLPNYFETLGKTWKYDYPDWKYEEEAYAIHYFFGEWGRKNGFTSIYNTATTLPV